AGNGQPEDAVEGSEVIVHRIHAPGVPADKDSYVLDYHIFSEVEGAGGKIVKNQDLSVKQFQVFPRTARLQATWDKDGKPFPDFRFKVMQNGAQVGEIKHTFAHDTVNVKGETIPAGSAEFNLDLVPGYDIVQVSPWEIVSHVKDAKEKRKYAVKGDLKFRAAFLNPPAGRIRQIVNFDPEDQGRQGIGHEVVVEVGVARGEAAGGSGTQEVHFRVTFGPESGGRIAKSKRKDADHPTQVVKADAADKATIEARKANEKYEGKMELANGAGRLKLCLGRAGGDTCKVEIAGSDKFLTDKTVEADQVLEMENWRRVHLELMVPDTLFDEALDPDTQDLRGDAQQRLDALGRQVFVEFVHADTRVFDTLGTADHGTLGPKRFFGLPGDPEKPAYILSGRNWRQLPQGQAWSADHPAKTLYISLCDLMLKWKKDTDDEGAGPKDFSGTLTAASGVVDAQERFQGLFMPFSGYDGGDGVTDVTWTADIGKDDAVCNVKPELTLEDFRYDFVESDAVDVEVHCGPAFGLPAELAFKKGADGRFDGKLDAGQTAALQAYVDKVLANRTALGETGGKVKAEVSCPKAGGKGEDDCLAAVKARFKEAFDKARKDSVFHPGLAADGRPRTGTCPLIDVTDMQASTSRQWHFLLPEEMPDGSVGPGAFVGPQKTRDKCPVRFEFSFQPHEASPGESEGKLLAWACSAKGADTQLLRLVLRSFAAPGDKAGLEHGHGDEGKAGDCFEKADAPCEKCLDYGRAASLATL
ncbi:MAG TPA: hypothetical protein VJ385_20890, partial [Fibrobacteria bacterium]|nr:hypothetical protein [Fibrobacteria bacterium]